MAQTFGIRTRSLAAILALALVAPPAVVWGYARGGGGGGYHSPYSGHATTSGADFSSDSAADHTSASHYDDSADYSHSYNGSNSAGAYNKNTGNGATYNKNTGTTTTYNKNTNTVNQYHSTSSYNNYNHNYSGYSNYHYNGSNYYVTNPHGYSTWGWHGGAVWYPTSSYWGGGFWGAFAAGAIVAGTTAAIIAASQPSYPTTYVVVQSSPGYTLLSSYGLRQVPCGPNLVVINYSGSVICAAPNATVAPGNYSVNIGTLTLVSM